MGLKHLEDVTYFRLNNEINRPVNGQIMLHKDKEALDAFFKENVVPNTMVFDSITDKINYLIEHNYIETAFLKKYRPEFLEELHQFIKDQNFQFKSFMAAYKFYNQYALKTNDGEYYLESMEDRVFFNALYFADGNEAIAIDIANEIIHQRYQPATPSFLNAGRARRGELVSCFLIQVTDDMNSIGRSINSALQLSRIGGGVGISLSNLREAGAPIKGYEGAASGVVPVMKLFEDSFSYSNQLGQRQGAGVVYLNVFHPDIIAFLSTKKENADEKVRVKTLSLGVVVPDKFYELARKNEEMYLFSPYSVELEYGVPFNYIDITEKYDELVANPNIRKTKIKARDLETEISKLQQESGYPYVVNIDTANRANPVDGKIIMSNLCSEILQVQEPSLINDAQEFLQMGTDVSCNLGSTNVVNMMTSPDFGRSIRAMVRALTFVTDSSHIVAVPTIDHGNSQAHTFGLGAMGLHSYLAQQLIEYGSPESVEFTSIYFMLMNYWTLVESNNIARERGITFHNFEKSDYANGKYFEFYTSQEFEPKFEKVRQLFDGIDIPTSNDWKELQNKVEQYGLYHAYRLAIAPTQSISYVQNATSSVMPIVDQIERRTYGNAETFYPMPFLSPETMWYYKSAFNTDQMKLIDLVATIQTHVDQGISTILYVNSEISTRELSRLYVYAHHKGLKSLYYTRNKLLSVEECTSCAI